MSGAQTSGAQISDAQTSGAQTDLCFCCQHMLIKIDFVIVKLILILTVISMRGSRRGGGRGGPHLDLPEYGFCNGKTLSDKPWYGFYNGKAM